MAGRTMTMNDSVVLDIKDLCKNYGSRAILRNINMQCRAGEVFGFLGPNGAGKTTTIKIVVGLLDKDSGDVQVCGKSLKTDFEGALRNIGAIVENPELYKFLSGMDNLKQFARMRGIDDINKINDVVRFVGMTNRINEKVKTYSLGMRQRLGVAQALLHDPKLLILDEPTNGLDPEGIHDLRNILKNLAHEKGICVVVSSHIMGEMEQLCDRVGIITNGTMVGTYTVDELINKSTGSLCTYEIKVDDAAKAAQLCGLDDKCCTVDSEKNILLCSITTENEQDSIADINSRICAGGVKLYTVARQDKRSLEDVFISLTHKTEGDGQIE